MTDIEVDIDVIDGYRCIECYVAYQTAISQGQEPPVDQFDFLKEEAVAHINATTGGDAGNLSHSMAVRFIGTRTEGA